MKQRNAYIWGILIVLAILAGLAMVPSIEKHWLRLHDPEKLSRSTLRIRACRVPLNAELVSLEWHRSQLVSDPNWRDFLGSYQGTLLRHMKLKWNGTAVRSFNHLDYLDEDVNRDGSALFIRVFGSDDIHSREGYFAVVNLDYDPGIVDGALLSTEGSEAPSLSGFILYGANTPALPWAHAQLVRGSLETLSITDDSLEVRINLYFEGDYRSFGGEDNRALFLVSGICRVPVEPHLPTALSRTVPE